MFDFVQDTRLAPLTYQETFDKVARHLFAQGRRAMRGRVCAYRGEAGRMCAVGVLIPDHLYHSGMDGLFTAREVFRSLVRWGVVEEGSEGLLGELQRVHDVERHWDSTVEMKQAFYAVAQKYRLDSQVLDDLSFSNTRKVSR